MTGLFAHGQFGHGLVSFFLLYFFFRGRIVSGRIVLFPIRPSIYREESASSSVCFSYAVTAQKCFLFTSSDTYRKFIFQSFDGRLGTPSVQKENLSEEKISLSKFCWQTAQSFGPEWWTELFWVVASLGIAYIGNFCPQRHRYRIIFKYEEI